jgi:hypothetical protein
MIADEMNIDLYFMCCLFYRCFISRADEGKRDEGRPRGLIDYPSTLALNLTKWGLSAVFRDAANQKSLTVRCFCGFSPSILSLSGGLILLTKQPGLHQKS